MLKLQSIVKQYQAGDTVVEALKGVDIAFRKSEFVSVLGPSGCGKTTLLNIIGGLDRYTSGDLSINGRSTREYKDADWDFYRNHSIGFIFQNYNLIPHQTVLSNVELALTLSGVSREERRKRALKALEQVGLSDQVNKKPTQMSGGQMQRVAIARALINDPEILLADEPTGALDSETSLQIMELLKEISNDRLIIMVTHNPDLANQYSSRIIRLLDGKVISDSNPYTTETKASVPQKKNKRLSMSYFTALSLSLNNLMTKKTRTFLTAFAGSIGIIGIALILSLSSGFQNYINRVQEETLSSYPITIERQTVDMTSMLQTMMGENDKEEHGLDKVYTNSIMSSMMGSVSNDVQNNDLKSFKAYLDKGDAPINEYLSDIQYVYGTSMQIYSSNTDEGLTKVNPSTVMEHLMMGMPGAAASSAPSVPGLGSMGGNAGPYSVNIWMELTKNQALLDTQYQVIAGSWPQKSDEVVLIIDKNNEVSDFTLYSIGLRDQTELKDQMKKIAAGEEIAPVTDTYTYDDILNLTFKMIPATDRYDYDEETKCWVDKGKDEKYMKEKVNEGMTIKVVGIVKPSEGSVTSNVAGNIGYLASLTEQYINMVNDSDIVKDQKEQSTVDIFTGIAFPSDEQEEQPLTMQDVQAYLATLPIEEQQQYGGYLQNMTEEQILELFAEQLKQETTDATYEGNLRRLGVVSLDEPSTINLYAPDFESKEKIKELIEAYNDEMTAAGKEENAINFTDFVGLLMSSVSSIINTISYVLIAFVAISLVVSSIMIGIITYISVLERTKEIGILRSIGASKRDVSRVFNAETIIVGFVSGILGIGITLLLNIPINAIIYNIAGVPGVAALPVDGAALLVLISMFLTFIAGLIPAKIAAKKDPVVALRTE